MQYLGKRILILRFLPRCHSSLAIGCAAIYRKTSNVLPFRTRFFLNKFHTEKHWHNLASKIRGAYQPRVFGTHMPGICIVKNAAFKFFFFTPTNNHFEYIFAPLHLSNRKPFLCRKNYSGGGGGSMCPLFLPLLLRNRTSCLINNTTKL
jgi:hypothetical protein